MNGLRIILCFAGVFILILLYWNARYQRRLRRHEDVSLEWFVSYFKDRGLSEQAAATVYKYYALKSQRKTFGVSPNDEVAVLFNQEGDDTDDDLAQMLKDLHLDMPDDSAWSARREPPLRTVEDIVRAIVWIEQNQPGRQHSDYRT